MTEYIRQVLFKSPSIGYSGFMSTVKEIEAAIPKLSPVELEELRAWLENFLQRRQNANGQPKRRRSVLNVRSLSGQWIGEPVLKGSDLADEMFGRA